MFRTQSLMHRTLALLTGGVGHRLLHHHRQSHLQLGASCRWRREQLGPCTRRNSRLQAHALGIGTGSNGSHTRMEEFRGEIALARQLWERNERQAFWALYHPFVVALAGGTLQMESFRNYIAQDEFFLAAFAKGYGLAMENTDDEEAKEILRGLQHHVQEELDQVHLSADKSWGLRIPDSTIPNSATKAYTDFLLAVATGDLKSPQLPQLEIELEGVGASDGERAVRGKVRLAVYTIAAMTPCMRLYAFLGQKISRSLKVGMNAGDYLKWVDTYASDDFESATVQSEKLVQKLAISFSGDTDRDAIASLYSRAMELEVEFFAAQTLLKKGLTIVPLLKSQIAANSHFLFVSDFDSTCTVSDSCPALADLTVSKAADEEIASGKLAPHSSASCLGTSWKSLTDLYTQEYSELLDHLLAAAQEQKTYHPATLRQALEEISEFERKANSRVVESGLLAGLGRVDVKRAGSTVPLREGCKDMLTRISQEMGMNLEFHILSVCWSRSFIEGSFSAYGLEFPNIHSNELKFDPRGVSDGDIVRPIQSAVDKDEVFQKLVADAKEALPHNHEVFSVYLGDSLTDLLCMLQADIGIVIGKSSALARVAGAFGITMMPLYSGLLQQEVQLGLAGHESRSRWVKSSGVLYVVSSWNELHAFLMGS